MTASSVVAPPPPSPPPAPPSSSPPSPPSSSPSLSSVHAPPTLSHGVPRYTSPPERHASPTSPSTVRATHSLVAHKPHKPSAPAGVTRPVTRSSVAHGGSMANAHDLPEPATSSSAHSLSRSAHGGLTSTSTWIVRRCRRSQRFLLPAVLVLATLFVAYHALHLAFLYPKLRNVDAPHMSRSNLAYALFLARRRSRRLLHMYQRQLHLFPMTSRAITAGIVFFIADGIAQLLHRPGPKGTRHPFSWIRIARYTVYGFALMGPFLHVWYAAMLRWGPPDDLNGAIIKSIFDEVTMEPICIVMYMFYDGFIRRQPYSYVRSNIRQRLIPLWFTNSAFWLPANFANYYVGTPDMRVIFSNLCSLIWNIYFSAKVNGPKRSSQVRPSSPKPRSTVKTPFSTSLPV